MTDPKDNIITVAFTAYLSPRMVKAAVKAAGHIPMADIYLCTVDKDWLKDHPEMPRYITTLGLSEPVTGEFDELDFKRFTTYKEMKQFIIDFVEALNKKYESVPLSWTVT